MRPFNADDVDRLGIGTPMMEVPNDFMFRVVNRLVQDTDELYVDPSFALVAEVARSNGVLQVTLKIQESTAGLHLLARYGYRGPWVAQDPGTITLNLYHALLQVGIEPGPPVVRNAAARAYIGRMITPVTEVQAHHLGITSETAANLSSIFILVNAEEFVAAADTCLVGSNPATEAEMQRTVGQLNMGISVQKGALSIDSQAHHVYHD